MPQESIDVYYKPLWGTNPDNGPVAYHKYIVYTKKDGNQFRKPREIKF